MPNSASQYLFEKIYHLLSPKEQREFDACLQARMENKQQDMMALFHAWKKNQSWEDIGNIIGKNGNPLEKRMDHLRGELQEEIEDFLAGAAFRRQQHVRDTALLDEIQSRGDKDLFQIYNTKLNNRLEKDPVRGAEYYREKFNRTNTLQAHLIHFPNKLRKNEDLAEKVAEHWTNSIKSEVFEIALLLFSQNLDPTAFIAPLLKWATQKPETEAPDSPFIIYRQVYEIYEKELWKTEVLPETYYHLPENLRKLQPVFSESSYTALSRLVFNFFTRRTKYFEKKEDFTVLIDIALSSFTKGPQRIGQQMYRTVISLYLNYSYICENEKEKKFYIQKAEDFLEDFKPYLDEAVRENAYQINKAAILFYKGEFESVYAGLLMSDPFYGISLQFLIIQAMYEKGTHITRIPEELHTLSQRLRQAHNMPQLDLDTYTNRVKMFKKLLKIETPKDRDELIETVKKTRPLTGRAWFMRKALEL
ncbi:MAG: hypothetical protein SF052_03170 [Bacteroidia bacterium]|nr:hypothetical protein [Bacteroidia bacterium]